MVLGDEAREASTSSMSHSPPFSLFRRLSTSALVFCFPALYLMLKLKLASQWVVVSQHCEGGGHQVLSEFFRHGPLVT